VYTRHGGDSRASVAVAAPVSPERTALDEAKAQCAGGDCEGARAKLEAALAEGSPLRSSPDFRDVETKWADQLLAKADGATDSATKQTLYHSVEQAMGVDPSRRKTAADKLQALQAISDPIPAAAPPPPAPAPAPSSKAHPDEATAAVSRPEGGRHNAIAYVAEPSTSPAAAAPAATPPATKPSGSSVDDRERALALQGTQDSKVLLKRQLEQRVNNGKASDTEIRLLIGTCKDLGDRACVQAARAALAQKQE
jgi:hypothetical protein